MSSKDDGEKIEVQIEIQKNLVNKLIIRIKEIDSCKACLHDQCCHGDHSPKPSKNKVSYDNNK